MLNQARLRVLKSRDDNISDILEEAKGRLGEVTKDAARWRNMLGDLITQVRRGRRLSVFSHNVIIMMFMTTRILMLYPSNLSKVLHSKSRVMVMSTTNSVGGVCTCFSILIHKATLGVFK